MHPPLRRRIICQIFHSVGSQRSHPASPLRLPMQLQHE